MRRPARQLQQRPPRQAPAHLQHGLSVVELMVGIGVGLVVIATTLMLLARHLHENRRLLLEARLLQDLRTTTDLMTRDLRRSGYWGDASAAIGREAASPRVNPYATLTAGDGAIGFSYSRDTDENHAIDSQEAFGYRLRNGAVEMELGAGNWQSLTDPGTMTVVGLSVTPQLTEISLAGSCRVPCPEASATCPPRQQVRGVALQVRAHAANDPSLVRSTQAWVRLRNDAIVGACPP